jgi:EAL domain-containing protein (putative c-di-GMP-specific phosphodiesterase class I)
VRIAMGECGTGYASLSYPERFPFVDINIDHSSMTLPRMYVQTT